jgi:phosphoenolpyruvate carboxylase
VDDQNLRSEVRYLGEILGEVIETKEGKEMLAFEERIRRLSKERRQDREGADAEL